MAQFPSSGDLSSFGLTPSVIKSIAIPNDIQAWPTSALNGCTALERITTFGEEIGTPVLTVVRAHFADCTSLKHITIPSSVAAGEGGVSGDSCVFPASLQSATFPASTRSIGRAAFFVHNVIASVDLSRCEKLTTFGGSLFPGCSSLTGISLPKQCNVTVIPDRFMEYCPKLVSIDLSRCPNLQTIENMAFYSRDSVGSSLTCIILPASLRTIVNGAVCYARASSGNGAHPNLRTIIWKGCSARPSGIVIADNAFGKPLDTLVSEKTIQEIFVP